MQEIDVGYNIADKNYGAVVYSKKIVQGAMPAASGGW
jgi:hypothetical protein